MRVAILVLNYNGRDLLAECLPSVIRAAARSRHACDLVVIDNDSSDDSCTFLATTFPEVRLIRRPNRGLCSYNDVIGGECGDFDHSVALLLNNDIMLDRDAVDPLVEPFAHATDEQAQPVFLTAPLCWQFDGVTCEGFKSAVNWRWGLVQATGRYPGHERVIRIPGETACAGAALAVDCRLFRELGGFDPLYLPGRLEDLDLAFRAWQRGWQLRYEPAAVAYHKGQVSFAREFGVSGCDQLALRNTLLFQWKNLRHPWHLARQSFGHGLRFVRDAVSFPFVRKSARWSFVSAWMAAKSIWRTNKKRCQNVRTGEAQLSRERAFFRRFRRDKLLAEGRGRAIEYVPQSDPALDAGHSVTLNSVTPQPSLRSRNPVLPRGASGGRR